MRHAIFSIVAAALLAACAGFQEGQDDIQPRPVEHLARWVARTIPATSAQSRHLYVANGGDVVTVYALGQKMPLRTVANAGSPLAFDHAGNLYVASNSGSVAVYARGTSRLIRKLRVGNGEVSGIALDHGDYVYAALHRFCDLSGCPGSVAIFAPASSKRIGTIHDHINIPLYVAVDPHSGDIFVVNGYDLGGSNGWISVYAPRTTRTIRVITDGFGFGNIPQTLAFNTSGDLYSGNTESVTVYAPNSKLVSRTISQGVSFPTELALDKSGELYVSNCTDACSESSFKSFVSVYARTATRPKQIITRGIDSPLGLALDDAGKLYVANWSSSTVTVYLPGRGVPSEIITDGIASPSALRFGP